ncbi:MAG TPA: MaoC family dehydratase [Acidothermaceae bacterium]
MTLYLEDLTPGQVFTGGPLPLTQHDIVEFGQQFDPQYFHTDPGAAGSSFFGGLAASGWHTASLSMRMAVESALNDLPNGLIGIEVRSLKWPRPARPGDILRLNLEVLESTPSRSRPGWGTVVVRWTTLNQSDEIVMTAEPVIWVARRPQ